MSWYLCANVCFKSLCLFVCTKIRLVERLKESEKERARESESKREREIERERKRERLHVCTFQCC